jgi:hypothetical protein
MESCEGIADVSRLMSTSFLFPERQSGLHPRNCNGEMKRDLVMT